MKIPCLACSSSILSAALLLVLQFLFVGGAIAQDGKLKEAKGDNFNKKLEKRYPAEAKRGEDSIFRSISDGRKAEKEEKKKVATVIEESSEKLEEKAEDQEKSGWLGGLFKKKPAVEEEKASEAKEKKVESKQEKKTEKEIVKKEEKSKPDMIVATPMLEDDGEAKSTLGGLFSGNLFGNKKTDGETKPEKKKKDDEVVVEADSLILQPVPKVEILTTQSGAGNGEGDFTSWDEVPYKRKSTVDRMMNKLNVRETATPAPKPLPALPAPVATTPAKPSPEAEKEKSPPTAVEKAKDDEKVRFSDN